MKLYKLLSLQVQLAVQVFWTIIALLITLSLCNAECRAGGLSFPALVTYSTFHAGYSTFKVELAVQVSRAVLLTSLRHFGWQTSGLSISALVANDSVSASSLFSSSAVPQNNTAYYGLFVLLTQLETHKPLSWTRRIIYLREFRYTYIVFCKVDVFGVHVLLSAFLNTFSIHVHDKK